MVFTFVSVSNWKKSVRVERKKFGGAGSILFILYGCWLHECIQFEKIHLAINLQYVCFFMSILQFQEDFLK